MTPGDVDSVEKVTPGTGVVVLRGLTKVAAYRDKTAHCTNILQSVLTSTVSSPGIPQKRPGIAHVTVRGLIRRER